ncbi:hypothetical protein ONZ51_g3916 [Trametes cubensis]|uniref:Uncharacterized protein n=1 Tax=Trametes cubensis TaxID=1111947 RepID=A0AAD7TXE6_9APHY|nr:hypothetical protein ONZ51_g3916 [Trametes cubensis]
MSVAEKYVTRTEFDELKARVQELEATLMRTLAGASPPAPSARRPSISATMAMTSGHPAEPVHGTAIVPYHAYGTTPAASPYGPPPPRPGSPRSPTRGEPPPFYRPPAPGMPGRSPTASYRAPPMPMPGTPARPPLPLTTSPPSHRSPVRHGSPGSASMSHSGSAGPLIGPGMRSSVVGPGSASAPSTSPSVRRSSISLADITTPYHASEHKPPLPPPGEPKNRTAQTTPPPGHRLRPSTPPGPALPPLHPPPHPHPPPSPPLASPPPAQAYPHRRIHIVDLRRRVPV